MAVRNATVAVAGASHQGATPVGSAFPESVSGDARTLVTGAGDPWLMVGDSAWSIFATLDATDAALYLDGIAAHGYNTILAMLVCRADLNNTGDGNNYASVNAWTGTAFQSTLTSSYWDHVEAIYDLAEARNITVVTVPAYIGYQHGIQGWSSATAAASNAQMETFGGAIGTRLADHPNLIWMIGHDDTPNSTDKARQGAMVDGIRAAGDTHLMAVDANRDASGYSEWTPWTQLNQVTVNTAYLSGHDEHLSTVPIAAYADDAGPVFMPEGQYIEGPLYTDLIGRSQFWIPFAAGALAGVVHGSYYVHTFQIAGWEDRLDSSLYLATERSAAKLLTLPWWHYRPDTTDAFLTAGENAGTDTAAAAAFHADHGGIVYMPTARSVTLALGGFTADNVAVRRWDPTNGAQTTLGTYATTGSQVVGSQGANSGGASDWLLIVENA